MKEQGICLSFFVEPLGMKWETRSELCRLLDVSDTSPLREIVIGMQTTPHHVWAVGKLQLEVLLQNNTFEIGHDYNVFLKSTQAKTFRVASREFLSLLRERTLGTVLSRIRIQNQHPAQSRFCYFVDSRTKHRRRLISVLKRVHEPCSEADMTTLTLQGGTSVEAWQVRLETLSAICGDAQLSPEIASFVYRWNMSAAGAHPESLPKSVVSKIMSVIRKQDKEKARHKLITQQS